MAEASTEAPMGTPVSDKESANGAAGPPSSVDDSIAEEVSIHLSPRVSNRSLSPGAKKAVDKNSQSGSGRTRPGRIGVARKSSIVKRWSSVKDKPYPLAAKQTERDKTEKCGMCEEQKAMKARCLSCQASMCGECLDHHKKMKISADHELQVWEQFLRQNPSDPPEPPPVPASKQKCKLHRDEKLQFYCKACLTPLCINCKLTKHEGHKTRDLWEEIAEQRENLPYKLSQIRASFLPLLKQQAKELEDHGQQVSYNMKGTLENIEKRARVMKNEIDRTSTKLAEKLKQKETKEHNKIDNRKQAIGGYIKKATGVLMSGERVVQSGDDFEVMEMYQNLLEMIRQITELVKRRPSKTRFVFQDGQLSQTQLQTMFGSYVEKGTKVEKDPAVDAMRKSTRSLRHAPSLQIVPEVHARLLKTFTCKMVPGNKVSAIAPINDREAWISFGWTTNEIYLYNKDGFRRNKLLFKQPVDDITADHDGNLIVSTFTGSIVRFVDKKLQIKDFFQCPLRCRGLDVSAAGEIIVCGVDMCTAMPPPSKCTIFKYTARGNKTGHLEGDKVKRIPVHPYRCAENIDGSLVVSDWVSDKEGRVVVFSHDGKVRMVYYGHSNEKRSFLPYGICTDKYGHIIVGDIINQEVHLLDIRGHFLQILLTRHDLDNERPYSVAVDQMGTLWVGNERAQIKIFRYLVNQSHIV